MTTNEIIYAVSSLLPPGFSRKDLLAAIGTYFRGTNPGSIQPSDYLSKDALKNNPSNRGNFGNYKTYSRFLERLGKNSYAFVG